MLKKLTGMSQKLSPSLLQIVSNIGWLASEKLLTMALSLSVGIYLIRYLGSVDFGKFSYCISFVGLFEPIAKLGVDAIAIRNLVEDEEATTEILGTTFWIKLIGSGLVIALTFISAKLIVKELYLAEMMVIIAIGILFTAFEAIDVWFQSQVRSSAMVIARSTQLIISSLLKLIFIALQFPLIAFVYLLVVDAALKAIGMLIVYCRHQQSIWEWDVKWSIARMIWRDSWPMILSSVMASIYMKIDQVMLGNLPDKQELGNYAAAVRFSELWYFIPLAICASLFPSIVRARQQSKQKYQTQLQQLYDLMAWLSILLAVGITLTSNTVLPYLLGEEYLAAGNILMVHIWSAPFIFLGIASHQWLVAENLSQYSFANAALGAISNVLLNLVLIPQYGGVGAAIATAISYAIASHLVCLLTPRLFNNGWMLTKALFIPLRLRQNFIYLSYLKKAIF
jgi:O-antigen/teichoic acid export membrane protein